LLEIKIGTKVRINVPSETDLHGKEGIIEAIDKDWEYLYIVHIFGNSHDPTGHSGCGDCDVIDFVEEELEVIEG